jgi:hypothetical protein
VSTVEVHSVRIQQQGGSDKIRQSEDDSATTVHCTAASPPMFHVEHLSTVLAAAMFHVKHHPKTFTASSLSSPFGVC